MSLDIIGAESMGVRSLCCLVTFLGRRIVIDPGISLGYCRYGLLPHPLQVAAGCRVRDQIVRALTNATDVVFSHFHGDHVPLVDANPYQLSVRALPSNFGQLHCWSKSVDDAAPVMSKRFYDLAALLGKNMHVSENRSVGVLRFSGALPHGRADSHMGALMMTRIEMADQVFVHASDIQLLDDRAVDQVIDWQPDIVLVGGPPLYLKRLDSADQERAWNNALRLVQSIRVVILDHHLMRSEKGIVWLDALSAAAGRKVYCAADFMGRPRWLLEANRTKLYEQMPVPDGWHNSYASGQLNVDDYVRILCETKRESF